MYQTECLHLISVSIPASVNSIGMKAFYGCYKLVTLICKQETPLSMQTSDLIFTSRENCTLWVPAGSVDTYKAAEVWKEFKEIKAITEVSEVSLNKNSLTLKAGDEESLTATVAPEDATDKTVLWTSSDYTIATVDHTGKITAVKAGTATITATHIDGEYTAVCNVTVEEENTTGVESFSSEKAGLYPNPTTGKIYYKLEETNIQKIMVSDISGRNILTLTKPDKSGVIDLSSLKNGMYLVNIYTDTKVFTNKILKNNF